MIYDESGRPINSDRFPLSKSIEKALLDAQRKSEEDYVDFYEALFGWLVDAHGKPIQHGKGERIAISFDYKLKDKRR